VSLLNDDPNHFPRSQAGGDFLTVNPSSSPPRRLSQSYSLRELWDPGRKTVMSTDLAPLVERLDSHIHLRDLVGAHHTK